MIAHSITCLIEQFYSKNCEILGKGARTVLMLKLLFKYQYFFSCPLLKKSCNHSINATFNDSAKISSEPSIIAKVRVMHNLSDNHGT